jgi:hypothetical protein
MSRTERENLEVGEKNLEEAEKNGLGARAWAPGVTGMDQG